MCWLWCQVPLSAADDWWSQLDSSWRWSLSYFLTTYFVNLSTSFAAPSSFIYLRHMTLFQPLASNRSNSVKREIAESCCPAPLMFWPARQPSSSPLPYGQEPHLTMCHWTLKFQVMWHVNPSNGLYKVHESDRRQTTYRRQTDRRTTLYGKWVEVGGIACAARAILPVSQKEVVQQIHNNKRISKYEVRRASPLFVILARLEVDL